jgi:hypothetical protein
MKISKCGRYRNAARVVISSVAPIDAIYLRRLTGTGVDLLRTDCAATRRLCRARSTVFLIVTVFFWVRSSATTRLRSTGSLMFQIVCFLMGVSCLGQHLISALRSVVIFLVLLGRSASLLSC